MCRGTGPPAGAHQTACSQIVQSFSRLTPGRRLINHWRLALAQGSHRHAGVPIPFHWPSKRSTARLFRASVADAGQAADQAAVASLVCAMHGFCLSFAGNERSTKASCKMSAQRKAAVWVLLETVGAPRHPAMKVPHTTTHVPSAIGAGAYCRNIPAISFALQASACMRPRVVC